MKLTCNTTFLDGRERFEAGEMLATESGHGCRVITADQAARFAAAGWVGDAIEPAPVAELDVHRSTVGQTGMEVRHG